MGTSVGVVMNGVTGRMGYRQHLLRSVLAINADGGLALSGGRRVTLRPVLVGRDAAKLAGLAARHGVADHTTDLGTALADDRNLVYFDAQVTSARADAVRQAIAAGKHVYAEKPVAGTLSDAAALAGAATAAGVRNGVVQDKLFLPGLRKLRGLLDSGFFGRVLSVRGEFGYWVFEGGWREAQRPSWNYRAAEGGGIVLDMFPHWHYVLENLFGRVEAVTARAVTHIGERVDERGEPYQADADDAAYGIFELAGGVIAQINSSWAVRVHRDELVEFQVDGTHGSAVAGLHSCRAQHRVATPRPVWNPDEPSGDRFRDQWQEVPADAPFPNAFRAQWELFLRHVLEDAPFPHDFASGTRGVQLAELGLLSSTEGRRVPVPTLDLGAPAAPGTPALPGTPGSPDSPGRAGEGGNRPDRQEGRR
ncbi:Gfo/Idh/MocA family oxidoreductase [Sphaerisporangium sp. B11E5]|uniref:Gfo/Idh/MocA family protein n=1 Tax=Sphaerisporangium sp. B11E5 TaxID=3153563 RepID=UPI00325DCF9E